MKQTTCNHVAPVLKPSRRAIKGILIAPVLIVLIGILAAIPARSVGQDTAEPGMAGDYSSSTSSIGRFKVVGIAQGISAALYEWEITMTNDAGEGFLHNVPGECVGLGLYEEGMDHQSGYCTYTDTDGDKFYERYEHFGIVGEGKGWSLGGTGKYEGIEATHKYRFEGFDAPEGSNFKSAAKRSGSYKFRTPAAAKSE